MARLGRGQLRTVDFFRRYGPRLGSDRIGFFPTVGRGGAGAFALPASSDPAPRGDVRHLLGCKSHKAAAPPSRRGWRGG